MAVEMVVDASALIAVITDAPAKPMLIQATTGYDLIAPTSVQWEMGNAFSAMLKQRRVTLIQVLKTLERFKAIPIRYVDVGLGVSLSIAVQLDLYAYDAYLLRCAVQYHAPLLTLDRELSAKARQLGVPLVEI
jgi:predicted nucleic acid-binding protein